MTDDVKIQQVFPSGFSGSQSIAMHDCLLMQASWHWPNDSKLRGIPPNPCISLVLVQHSGLNAIQDTLYNQLQEVNNE